jgi:hypothetical protein
MSDYSALVDQLRHCADNEDDTRLMMGELASILRGEYGDAGLKQASIDTHLVYKTLAERRRVVEYYQQSAGQIGPGASVARELLAEFPVLRWTHLRVAKGLSRDDPSEAIKALAVAVEEALTPQQFKRYVARLKASNGHRPERYKIDGRAGYDLTIRKRE